MESLATEKRRIFTFIGRKIQIFVLCLFLAASGGFLTRHEASAQCINCPCVAANHVATRAWILAEHGAGQSVSDPEALAYVTADICATANLGGLGPAGLGNTRGWIAQEFCEHREQFIVFYWFKEHVLAALMMMTEQLVSSAMNQMLIVGAFFDAAQQLETQRTFQELAAKAHKDYHPSFEMCEIGTLARNLASTQLLGEHNAYSLAQHLQDRQMRSRSMSSAPGRGYDTVHRWENFKGFFCNPGDNNGELGNPNPICTGTALSNDDSQRDRDVDYTTMVEWPNTIPVNFADNTLQTQEESIFGLASNLYGNNVFEYFPEAYFKNPENHDDFMYLRAIVAKRSVAQNSFNNIVGMKSEGLAETEDLRLYMAKVLEQLGITDSDHVLAILGNRPSYYAQMEFLSKKLYQRPEFYTNLYDKPANVERKKAAMKAIGLVQNMDLFKSKLRAEAALAVLTDLEINKVQEQVQDRMREAPDTGL